MQRLLDWRRKKKRKRLACSSTHTLSHLPCGAQELEALAKKLEEEKKAIEDAAKNLREEKDSADQ